MGRTRVFLSYAEEDESAARQLAEWLTECGLGVFWWQNPETRGDRFVKRIPEELAKADYVVVLMSPAYLASEYCTRESELAVQREVAGGAPVVRVVEVAQTDYGSGGFLSSYDWVRLRPPFGKDLPSEIAAVLGLGAERSTSKRAVLFRNRDEEVAKVRHAFEMTTGQDFWVVVSPPRLGKSWFLQHLHDLLRSGTGRCTVRLLDLRDLPELWSNPVKVLAALLDVEITGTRHGLTDEQVRAVARQVFDRGRQFYLLDSADRLDRASAPEVRRVLSDLHRRLNASPRDGARFGVVVGTRQHEDWKGLRLGAQVRFEPIALTEFTPQVVAQVVQHYEPTWTARETRACGELLHRLSEGLPALLVRWLDWAEEKRFFELAEDAEADVTFESVVRPYVESDLLAPDVLFPRDYPNAHLCRNVLERALETLSVYRLITRSHLVLHFEGDEELRGSAAEIGWTVDHLWEAITRTTILDSDNQEVWQEISRPIRRVLYRHYFRSDAQRSTAHRDARACYERWVVKEAAKEQGVMMVECLWHEMSRLLLEQRSEVPDLLPARAGDLAREFLDNSTMYSPGEFARFLSNRLVKDVEFQEALRDFTGLFDEVLASITRSLSEGG